jgi:putative PIN family toxin of toxin-antitoxin system
MKLVLDTNIVLDLFVFRDSSVDALRDSIAAGEVQWLATPAMREELACVLAYEQMALRMKAAATSPQEVLEAFDRHSQVAPAAPPAPMKCRDEDDQKFVDLAAAHGASLLSRDSHVLALRRKLPVARSFSALLPQKTGPAAPSASRPGTRPAVSTGHPTAASAVPRA